MNVIETYLAELADTLRQINPADIEAVKGALFDTLRTDGVIYLCGNGGSAATAAHIANDLNKFTQVAGRPRFRAMALTDNVPYLTALANDLSYADVFVEQLRNWLRPNDALIAISASGNSPNVLRAAAYANQLGALTIGLCGAPGGQLAKLVRLKVIIPSHQIGHQEDGHLIVGHALSLALRTELQQREP